MNRGARRQAAFLLDGDRTGFLQLLGHVRETYDVRIHAYCLMGNHFHLLVHSPESNLSDAMQYVLAVYTRRFNRRHGLDGALLRGRFHSEPIDSDAYLLQTSRYIHRNPLDIDPTVPLEHYWWSSYAAYVGTRSAPAWLDRSMVLGLVGHDEARYRAYVERPQPTDHVQPRTNTRSSATDHEQPAPEPQAPGIVAIEKAVARITGVPEAGLRRRSQGRQNLARALTLTIAVDQGCASTPELMGRYGFAHPGSIRNTVHRTRRLLASDSTAAAIYDRATRLLTRT